MYESYAGPDAWIERTVEVWLVDGGRVRSGVLLRRLMHNCSDQQVGQVTQWSTELEVEVLPAGVGGDLRR
jgi:hypothetical protein